MKKLKVKKGSTCMACLACVGACSEAFYKVFDPDKACLQIVEKKAVRPIACPQCGKCAEACPEGAITQNPKGVYMINKKKCTGCGACAKTGEGCFRKDVVNEFVAKAGEADGYIFGSPVHYAAASGALTSFMDRAFYSGGSKMTGKPAAAVVSCRRGGASAAFDQINKYFTINCMPVVGSQYWNQVHGGKAEEVKQDEEGMQTMRTLGNNMAWLLSCIEAGKEKGITFPEREPVIRTNYIR